MHVLFLILQKRLHIAGAFCFCSRVFENMPPERVDLV